MNQVYFKMEAGYPRNRKVSNVFARHPKPAAQFAILLHEFLICYCKDQQSDGYVPESHLPRLAAEVALTMDEVSEALKVLLAENLLAYADDGFSVPGFTERNGTKAEWDQRAEIACASGRRGGLETQRKRRSDRMHEPSGQPLQAAVQAHHQADPESVPLKHTRQDKTRRDTFRGADINTRTGRNARANGSGPDEDIVPRKIQGDPGGAPSNRPAEDIVREMNRRAPPATDEQAAKPAEAARQALANLAVRRQHEAEPDPPQMLIAFAPAPDTEPDPFDLPEPPF
jgi:hypothetical protein